MFVASALLLVVISTITLAQNQPPEPRYNIFDQDVGVCIINRDGNCAQTDESCEDMMMFCRANKRQMDADPNKYTWFCECLTSPGLERFLRKSRKRVITSYNYRFTLMTNILGSPARNFD